MSFDSGKMSWLDSADLLDELLNQRLELPQELGGLVVEEYKDSLNSDKDDQQDKDRNP